MVVRRVQLLLLSSPLRRLYPYLRRSWQLLRYALGRPHEEDFAAFACFSNRTGLFLDVGASSGTSAMSFRIFNRASPILSVEPNEVLEPELRFLRRVVSPFNYLIAAAGERNAVLSFYVPFFRDIPITAEASLFREAIENSPSLSDWLGARICTPEFRIVETRVPVQRLDDLRLEPDFVKIDVQGAELSVLHGLKETLHRSHPILLIERGTSFTSVADFLAQRGYGAYVYRPTEKEFVAFDSTIQSLNVFFLLEDVAAAVGARSRL